MTTLVTRIVGGSDAGSGAVGARGLVVVPSPICPSSFAPQHDTCPPVVSAHTCCQEAEIALMSVTPATGVGKSGAPAAAPASPSWPTLSSPQQSTPPLTSTAHEKFFPAARILRGSSSAAATLTPATCWGRPRSVSPRSPSWPVSSAPQQNTAPTAVAAQVWLSPVATAMTSSMAVTRTGSARGVRVPSPS